jgi:hypothetical protein
MSGRFVEARGLWEDKRGPRRLEVCWNAGQEHITITSSPVRLKALRPCLVLQDSPRPDGFGFRVSGFGFRESNMLTQRKDVIDATKDVVDTAKDVIDATQTRKHVKRPNPNTLSTFKSS